jgi:hypothetical protein
MSSLPLVSTTSALQPSGVDCDDGGEDDSELLQSLLDLVDDDAVDNVAQLSVSTCSATPSPPPTPTRVLNSRQHNTRIVSTRTQAPALVQSPSKAQQQPPPPRPPQQQQQQQLVDHVEPMSGLKIAYVQAPQRRVCVSVWLMHRSLSLHSKRQQSNTAIGDLFRRRQFIKLARLPSAVARTTQAKDDKAPLLGVYLRSKEITAAIAPTSSDSTGRTLVEQWGTIAVLCKRSSPKDTSNGSKYCACTFTDLAGTEIGVFVFARAFEVHWSAPPGALFAIVCPEVWPYNQLSRSLARLLVLAFISGLLVCSCCFYAFRF